MPPADSSKQHHDTIVQITRSSRLRPLSLERAEHPTSEPIEAPHLKIRLANSEGRRSKTSYLIKRQFAWRGYEVAPLSHLAANRITLAAFGQDEQPIATITVGVDCPAGLAVEAIYPEEVKALRASGKRLGEFTKLAVDNVVRSQSVLAAIFHIAYIYAYRIRGCTDLVIEVNPRHVRFYESKLGFEVYGQQRMDSRVGALAVLLKLPLAHAEAEIARIGGHAELAHEPRASLYPLFFSPVEERGIEGRLRSLQEGPGASAP